MAETKENLRACKEHKTSAVAKLQESATQCAQDFDMLAKGVPDLIVKLDSLQRQLEETDTDLNEDAVDALNHTIRTQQHQLATVERDEANVRQALDASRARLAHLHQTLASMTAELHEIKANTQSQREALDAMLPSATIGVAVRHRVHRTCAYAC